MTKIKILLIFSFFHLLKSDDDNINNILDKDEDDEAYYLESLTTFINEYMEEKNFLNSDKLITQNEMTNILVDILLMGDSPDEVSHVTMNLYYELSRRLTNKYFNKYKEIRESDLLKVIDVEELAEKLQDISEDIPFFDDEDDDYNNDL